MTGKLTMGIATAGIGGLTTAALLARDGHGIQVFNQFEAPRSVGSGLEIQPVGRAVLGAAGAETGVAARGARPSRICSGTQSRAAARSCRCATATARIDRAPAFTARACSKRSTTQRYRRAHRMLARPIGTRRAAPDRRLAAIFHTLKAAKIDARFPRPFEAWRACAAMPLPGGGM